MWDAAASGVRFAPSDPATPPMTTASSSSKSRRSVTGGRHGLAGAEHGVRVREVEGRRLVPLRHDFALAVDRRRSRPRRAPRTRRSRGSRPARAGRAAARRRAAALASHRSTRREQSACAASSPRASTSATVSPSGNGTTRSSITKPSPIVGAARASARSSCPHPRLEQRVGVPPRMRSRRSRRAGRRRASSATGSSRPMSNGKSLPSSTCDPPATSTRCRSACGSCTTVSNQSLRR